MEAPPAGTGVRLRGSAEPDCDAADDDEHQGNQLADHKDILDCRAELDAAVVDCGEQHHHENGKELALQFCTAYSAILSKNTVIATGTTGRMLAQTTGLPVHCYLSGRLGGVQQITSRIACDEVDLVLFFRDPLKADAASITEQNLLRLCDMHSVPIATNIATAEVLLRGMDQGDLDYREGMHPALVEPMPTVQRHAV